jgi:hypothetical protein
MTETFFEDAVCGRTQYDGMPQPVCPRFRKAGYFLLSLRLPLPLAHNGPRSNRQANRSQKAMSRRKALQPELRTDQTAG